MAFKNVFIDTNILVDLIADRKPFTENAILVFDNCLKSDIKIYTTFHAIATLHYIVKKIVSEKELRLIISDLLNTMSVIAVTESILKKSLKSDHKDFEDAIQIVSEQSIDEIDCIITRDLKDYKNAEIDIFAPDEFLDKL